MPNLDIDADTRWRTLFDTLATSEQSCIRDALGDELASVLEQRVLSEGDTERSDALLFGCLDPGTAAGVFLSVFVAQMGGLTEETEGCLAELLANIDVAGVVASELPDASPDAVAAALGFGLGLFSCVPELAFPGGTGPYGPPIDDEALLWRYAAGGWVVNAPTVADGVAYVGADDNNVYALAAETGEALWSFETGDVIRSTPTVTGGAVYVGSNDNHVYALDAEDGRAAVAIRHRRVGAVLPRGEWRVGLLWGAAGWRPQGPCPRLDVRRTGMGRPSALSLRR